MRTPSLETIRPRPVKTHADGRGTLWKVIPGGMPGRFGELYALATVQGAVRGNHYHRLTTEVFFVVRGSMRCRLVHPQTRARSEWVLDAADPAVLEVPPGIAHSLTGFSSERSILMAYADRPYDDASPDTVPFHVSDPE